MVWKTSSNAPLTPLNDLGPFGPIISPEGVIFTDIRSIFKPHEGIDSPILFQVLERMLQDGTLHAYKIVRVPYRPILELCHPHFSPHSLWPLSEEYQDGIDQADTSGDDRHDGTNGCSGCDDCGSSGSDDGEGDENDDGGGSDGGGSGGNGVGGIRDIDNGGDGSCDSSSDNQAISDSMSSRRRRADIMP